MILCKRIINEKEVFEEVDIETAKKLKAEGVELVYTTIEEEKAVNSDHNIDEDNNINEENDNKKDKYKKYNDYFKGFTDMFTGEMFSKHIENAKPYFSDKKSNSKANKLLKVLPFMEEEDIHEIVNKMLENDESFKDVRIESFLPFLSEEDCDKIFMKALEDGNYNFEPSSIAPFVSEEALSKVVDLYVKGEFNKCNIENLYPFLSSEDIKRIFIYIIDNE